jgi:integrase
LNDHPLAEWLEQVFIPAAGARKYVGEVSPVPFNETTRDNYRAVVRLLSAFLRRPATVADLNAETMTAFLAWHAEAFPNHGRRKLLAARQLLRFVQVLKPPKQPGKSGRPNRPLSTEGETLWGICEREYFPRSIRIRSDATRKQYRLAIADFAEFLGRDPVIGDLNEDDVTAFLAWQRDRKDRNGAPLLSPKTCNERIGRLKALWGWLAKRRRAAEFPDVPRLPEPWRTPAAWREDQLAALFAAAKEEIGILVPGIWARDWWLSLHYTQYDCGERIGALLQARWEHLDFVSGSLNLPAEIRKAKRSDKINPLRPHTMEVLARMKQGGHDLIWPWPWGDGTFYSHLNRQLRRAHLPTDRKSKTHRMRRTTATHLARAGVDASIALGHSDGRVTRDSYLDTTQLVETRYCDLLPLPSELARVAPAALPAPEPKRLPYYPSQESEVAPELAWL